MILDNTRIQQTLLSLINSKIFLNKNEDFHYFFLKRIGYCEDHENNSHFLVYLNNGNKIINQRDLHKDNFCKTKILMYFNLFIQFVKKCHENNLTLGFLHPELIFVSRVSGFQLIDCTFNELFKEFDFINSYPLNSFFGIMEIEKNMFNNPFIKKTNDIIMLCMLLGYLFSNEFNGEESHVNYNKIVNSLHKDFFTKNSNFSNFLSIVKDKDIKEFLTQILNINYSEIVQISEFNDFYNKIIQNHLKETKCFNKNCLSHSAKKMNLVCEHLLCEECYKSSNFIIIKEKEDNSTSNSIMDLIEKRR